MNHDPISRATPGGAAADHRTGVGGLLRASRLRCGEDLDVIAQVLRIRRRHLQAIEDGNFDQLPGTTYAVGFIRTYADYLGLDSDEVVRRFKGEQTLQPGKTPKADLVFPSPMSETGIPRGAVVFLGVVIGVIAYGGWYSSTVDNDFFKQWIEPVPARLAALLPGGAESDGPDRSQAVAADKPAPTSSALSSEAAPEPTAVTEAATEAVPSADVGSDAQPSDAQPSDTQTSDTQASDQPAVAAETAAASDTGSSTESPTESPTEQAPPELAQTEPAPTPVAEPTAVPAPAGEPATASSAPESVSAAAPMTETETVRPPESIAQPVETAELPAPPAPAASDAPTPAAEASETPPTPAAVEVASTPAETAEARIVLTAISDSWVEVREQGTDTWVWGKLLRAGESYAVPDRPDLKLKTGNAGGLTITVDGDSAPAVGASGEVVRNVLLDPERLKAGTAVFR
ncbi:MAG: RodZ domain-containing protein [Alphaproteobacteria bacterium]